MPFVRLLTLVLLITAATTGNGQNMLSEPDPDGWRIYDRMSVLSGGGPGLFHAGIRPLWRHDLVALADSVAGLAQAPDRVTRFQVQQIWDQNNEFVRPAAWPDSMDARYRLSRKPFWSVFYRTPAHLYEVDVHDFYLRIDPLLHFGVGRESEEGVTTYVNSRGLRLRGGIGQDVWFQTSFYDSQTRYPNYVNVYTDDFGVVPGVGFYKDFNSSLFDSEGGRDYLLATAFVGFNFGKYIGMQVGHNQHFIGEGVRSLLLSDFSTPFFSIRFNTRIWKIHYQNIFAELSADDFMSVNGTSEPIEKKFMAAHYLSFKASRTVTLGLFESVIFDRESDHFEWQYFNPIILYRSVEGALGSPDNVMLGFNARVEAWRTAKFYGQLMIDDLQISQILDGESGWWGNKFGIQLGANYYNAFGIEHLDLQAEWNRVRPFTYSHYNAEANYSHYNQALAHPLGANFNEVIGVVRYQPLPRLTLEGQLYVISTGEDRDTVSYGANILVPNTQRVGDYGNVVGQGVATDILFGKIGASWQISPELYADLYLTYRNKQSESEARALRTQQLSFAIRYNMARREDIF